MKVFRENSKTFLNGKFGMIPDSVNQMLAGMEYVAHHHLFPYRVFSPIKQNKKVHDPPPSSKFTNGPHFLDPMGPGPFPKPVMNNVGLQNMTLDLYFNDEQTHQNT